MTPMLNRKRPPVLPERAFARSMLRSAVVSLFWGVIAEKRKRGFQLQHLAEAMAVDKSAVSRWFGARPSPNFELNTVADIAEALGLDIEITARDRATGQRFAEYGIMTSLAVDASVHPPTPRHGWQLHVGAAPGTATVPAAGSAHTLHPPAATGVVPPSISWQSQAA